MEVSKFLREWRRMCKSMERCKDCGMNCRNTASGWKDETIANNIMAVEKWSAEHPPKTRLDDLKEKYPDVPLDDNGRPYCTPWHLGYCKGVNSCPDCDNFEASYEKCWDMPLEGE